MSRAQGIKRYGVFLPLVLAFALGNCLAPAAEFTVSRWAVVSGDDTEDRALADLLTVRLSQWDRVELVEREAIDGVLKELSLSASGLVERDSALQFGKLASAAAILVVERDERTEPPVIRARLVETRTGVRLADELLPDGNAADQVEALVKRLQMARRKLDAKNELRHYLSVLEFRSEEPGPSLDAAATTLSVLVEHGLKRQAHIVVLEREELRRLRDEQNLTGIELELRGSSLMLDGGLRRAADGRWQVDVGLVPLSGDKPKHFTVAVPSDDLPAAQTQLVEAVVGALNPRNSELDDDSADVDLRYEAELLLKRSKWILVNDYSADVSGLVDAALVLDPSVNNFLREIHFARQIPRGKTPTVLAQLQAALRANQIDVKYVEHCVRADPMAKDYPTRHLYLDSSNWQTTSPEERRLKEQIDELYKEKYDILVAARRGGGRPASDLVFLRMNRALIEQTTPEAYMKEIRILAEELDREPSTAPPPGSIWNGPPATMFYYLASEQFKRIAKPLTGRVGSRLTLVQPQLQIGWGIVTIRPLLDWLVEHDEPCNQLLGRFGLALQGGQTGVDASREFLDAYVQYAATDGAHRIENWSGNVGGFAMRLHEQNRLVPWFESHLKAAEQSGDIRGLMNSWVVLGTCLYVAGVPQGVDWSKRVIAVLDANDIPSDIRRNVAQWRSSLELGIERRTKPESVEPPTDNGWADFDIRELTIDGRSADMQKLFNVAIDARPGVVKPLILIWQKAPKLIRPGAFDESGRTIITRLGIDGGHMNHVADLQAHGYGGTLVAASPEAIYLASTAGIAKVSRRETELFPRGDRLPDSPVDNIAWLERYLYFSMKGAIGRLDPARGEFELLATNKASHARSDLDGGRPYEVRSMLADPEHGCLWLSIRDQLTPARSGIWRFTSNAERFECAFVGNAGFLSESEAGIFFLHRLENSSESAWNLLDTETGRVQRITSRLRRFYPTAYRHDPGWVYVGDGIVTTLGSLFTPDGKMHRHKRILWDEVVGPLGKGLITASYKDAKLWYIEPKESSIPLEEADANTALPTPDAALEFLDWIGAELTRDDSGEAIGVSLHGNRISSHDVRYVAALPCLRSVDLSGTLIDETGIILLEKLSDLETLDLRMTMPSVHALQRLSRLQRLRELSIFVYTNDMLAAVANIGSIEKLHFEQSSIWPFGLRALKRLKRLTELSFKRCGRFDDKCAQAVSEFQRLRTLRLDDTGVTDEGMYYISRMRNLEHLSLAHTGVSDACMEHLAKLKRLQTLDLTATDFTPDGVVRLRKLLPKTTVVK